MIKRFHEDYLGQWLTSERRKPLILRGARQVGKSTLVHMFAETNGLTLVEINLERHLYLTDIFATMDPERILREIETAVGTTIPETGGLLFIDEIQAIPQAIQALRYFYEELPGLPVVTAGSLLEFTLADHSFSMPVGRVEYCHLGPVTFLEFVSTCKPHLAKTLQTFSLEEEITKAAHQQLLDLTRVYFAVGGMPEALQKYLETGSIVAATRIHRTILDTYTDDFAKYARHSALVRLQRLFQRIPREIGRKVKYSNLSRDDRSRDVKADIDLLAKSRTCLKVHHSNCNGLPLYAEVDDTIYKLLFLDIGLANTLLGNDWLELSAMNSVQLVNEGVIAEQFVGQELINVNREQISDLTYWLREGKSANAEVDYVWARGRWIVPIEVKAGKSGSLKSLHQFVLQKSPPITVRFDLNPPSMQTVDVKVKNGTDITPITFRLLSLPLYAVSQLPRLVDTLRAEN